MRNYSQLHQFLVLTLALLDDVLLLQDLLQSHALLVKQSVHVGHGPAVKFPKHPGQSEQNVFVKCEF